MVILCTGKCTLCPFFALIGFKLSIYIVNPVTSLEIFCQPKQIILNLVFEFQHFSGVQLPALK